MDSLEIPVGAMTFTARADGPDQGELVLLLHGFPQTSYEWRRQLTALAGAGYRAVAFDQRGYSAGARPEGVEHYRIDHLVADVLAIADWIGGHTFHLVGHDWGAMVAWVVAARYPERLRTLSAVSVPHPTAFVHAISTDDDQRQRSEYIGFLQQPDAPEKALLDNDAALLRGVYAGLPADAVDEYVRVLSEPGALTAGLNYYRAIDSTLAELGSIAVPTMFVWSTDDVAIGRAGADATAQHVEAAYRFEVLKGVSHWIPDEAPDALNRLLVDHLSSSG